MLWKQEEKDPIVSNREQKAEGNEVGGTFVMLPSLLLMATVLGPMTLTLA